MKKPSLKNSSKSAGKTTGASPPPVQPDGRKRTIAITLLALGAGAVTIGAFSGSGSREQNKTFRDPASCEADKTIPAEQCRQNFTQAQAAHERSAPSYSSRETCEREFGSGSCVNPSANSGRGSVFIPAMAGFMMGRMASGGFQSAPLYRRPGDPDGEFRQSAAFPVAPGSGSSSSSSSGSRSWNWSSGSSTSTSTSSSRSTTSTSSGITSTSRGGFGSSSHGSSSS